MVNDHLAKEATRLMSDEIFLRTLAHIRSDALNALAKADADEKTTILRLQQKVEVIDDIRNGLDRYIIAAAMQEDAGSFA